MDMETEPSSPAQPAASPTEPADPVPISNTYNDGPGLDSSPTDTITTTTTATKPADHAPNMTTFNIHLAHSLTTILANTPSTTSSSNPDHGETYDVPAYTETDPCPLPAQTTSNDGTNTGTINLTTPYKTLITHLTTNPSLPTLLSLPLTTYPAHVSSPWTILPDSNPPASPSNPSVSTDALCDEDKHTIYQTQTNIIAAFFKAITSEEVDVDLVRAFVRDGLVAPDVPDRVGRTPLVAAVERGSGVLICELIALGARVDGLGRVAVGKEVGGGYARRGSRDWARDEVKGEERSPLMVAAALGNLALVRLLRDDFGADDGIIAPDGQMALRLAADAGHREVVEYLPARRGGAWRRWRTAHAAAVGRVTRAVVSMYRFFRVLLWSVPKFFVWDVPKYAVVKPLAEGCKYCWENKHKLGGWCKRQAVEFPGRVKRAGKAVWNGVKKVPKGVWRVAKEIPGAVERLIKWLWKITKRIPSAMKTLCVWIWDTLKKAGKTVGKAIGNVFLRVVAVLHTAVAAVLDFFRNIKLKDVWHGVCDVVEAIVRGLPRALLTVVKSFGMFWIVVAGIIIGILGVAGEVVVFLVKALWYVAKYVPRQLGEIIAGIWATIAKGYHEIMVWINPKHC